MQLVSTLNAQPTGPTPVRREDASPKLRPVTRVQRESALQLALRERRRIERRSEGRFDYLKRTYD